MMEGAQECSRGPKACKSCWIHYVDELSVQAGAKTRGLRLLGKEEPVEVSVYFGRAFKLSSLW